MASVDIEELKVIANARQKYSDRFDTVGEGPIVPANLAKYRNNLAACSKYYNLFFLACLDTILVYKPQGQHQILISPEIAIPLAKTNIHGAHGYISETYPHAANHLVVADLGLEEVLIAACDDGDVVAYTTLSIYQEIDRQRSPNQNPRPPHAWDHLLQAKLRPFLLRNLGMSAWGIAVHEKYRMIAVSSNAHKIHVFIFALSYPLHPSLERLREMGIEVEDPPYVWSPEWSKFQCWDPFFPHDRSRNLELILHHHKANIPSIAFYNPHDPASTDVFLVSTDINGLTYIWDVWNRRIIYYNLGSPNFVLEDRAWGLLCLDPYFCRPTTSSQELFGGPAVSRGDSRLDITETTRARAATDIAHSGGSVYDEIWSMSPLTHLYTAAYVPGDFDNSDDSDIDVNSIESETSSDMDLDEDPDMAHSNVHTMPRLEPSPCFLPYYCRPSAERPRRSDSSPTPPSTLPFRVLHTNRATIRLFHNIPAPFYYTKSPSLPGPPSEIICRSPLVSKPRSPYAKLLTRLNMVHQIPDLGLVVIGDQAGRVGLFSLTCLPNNKPNQDANDNNTTTTTSNKDDDKSPNQPGLRLETVLPLEEEEKLQKRPRIELLGVAVGPLQGYEFARGDGLDRRDVMDERGRRWDGSGGRKWKVLLYYADHTVMSYEISRPTTTTTTI